MKSLFVPAFALLFASTVPVFTATTAMADPPKATAATPSVDDAVAKVQAFYDQSKTFKADFDQTFQAKAYGEAGKKFSTGSVTFEKPGKMRFDYKDGNKVVADGKIVKVFQAKENPPQMFEQNMDRSQYPAALSFLTGQGRLAEQFNMQIFSGDKFGFKDGYVLVGVPKVRTPAYEKVLFYVDARSSQVRRVLILDAQGNRNRFDFKNPRVNDSVNASLFQFTAPPGTSIIRPNN